MNPPAAPVHLILPVHNRRATTLRCLAGLRDTGIFAWTRVVVVDDGSTDGTADAIHAQFPEAAVLPGDGSLYWTGAITLGMRHAVQEGTACCVWLNDDSRPLPGAIERIVRYALAHRCVAAGLGRFVGGDRVDDPLIFHTFRKARWGLRPFVATPDHDGMIAVDACRGNLVAIPREIIDAIGYPDAANLPHFYGDTDYTLRAVRAGFRCLVDPSAVVEELERSGDWDDPWLTTRRPLRLLWRRFALKQAGLYWRANWVYLRRHWGGGRGGLLFLSPYVRLVLISLLRSVVPRRWIRRLVRR